MPIRPHAVRIATSLLGLIFVTTLTACGSSGGTAAPAASAAGTTAAQTTAATSATEESADDVTTAEESITEESTPAAAEPAPDGSGDEADCPISAADISAVTGLSWEFQLTQAARPLESDETITTTVCAFTAPEVVDQFGDPAFLRTDLITGADVAKQQQAYASTCTEYGGVLSTGPVSGGVLCARDGIVSDGQVGSGDRLVEVFVNSGTETSAQFTAVFDELLAAVS